jgi:membrane-associated phospholipid phosphatase
MFQNYISMICSSRTMYAVLTMVYLISRRKITSMVFLIFFITSGYLNSLEKMLFMDPRPFWTSSAVRQFEWHCPADFGNPSGHSRSSAYFYFLLFYDLLVRDAGPVVWLWLCLLIAIMTPFSRMYLGAHSANQVTLGLLIGFAFLVIYKYGLQRKIYGLFNSLIRRKTAMSLIIICFLHLVCFMIPLLSYEYKVQNPNTHLMLDGLSISCPRHPEYSGLRILTSNFVKCSVISFIFGMLVAVWASEFRTYRYYYGQWNYNGAPIVGKVLRILA